MAETLCSSISAVSFKSNGYNPQTSKSLRTNCSFTTAIKPSRLSIFHKNGTVPSYVIRAPTTCCLGGSCSETFFSLGNSDAADDPSKEAAIDIKLPRRSLLVNFTCKSCGERTKRLINRLAYERGTVFVQCAGCLQYHKLIDNLNLVVEYDFRENSGVNANEDQL